MDNNRRPGDARFPSAYLQLKTFTCGVILSALVALPTTDVGAFEISGDGHLDMTQRGIQDISRTIDGETLRFSRRALSEIRRANALVDANQFNSALHFDNEALTGGSQRIVDLKTNIINEVTNSESDGSRARQSLGGALHTIQDFLAHSNAVDLGLGIPRFGETVLAAPPADARPCGLDAVTLLDAVLTTGYFPACTPPARRCRHGTPVACPTGIAKDDGGHPFHGAAVDSAIAATTQFVNDILNAPGISGNAKATKRLMDVRPTLGVIIDDTGSMGPVISQVKVGVAQIINSVKGTKNEPDQYLLQTFNDPTVGPTQTFNEPDPFLAAVNAVSPGGGGDCPELAWSGTFLAVTKALSDSTLFMFTDASAKDTGIAGNASALAKKKRIKINPVLFGSCSPFDTEFFDVAQATGGQVFTLNMSETGAILNLLAPLIQTDSRALFSVRTNLTGSTIIYDVAVDETITEATFSVSMPTKGTIDVLRPSGAPVQPGDTDATITELSSGRIVTIASPEIGNWRVRVTGSGSLSVAVNGLTDLFLNQVDFAEFKGRTAHEALFPIDGSPIVGRATSMVAELFGPYSTASFELRDAAGNVLQTPPLAQGNPNADPQAFVGGLTPPNDAFLVYVTGVTAGGNAYQRHLPGEVLASTVEVRSPIDLPAIPAGRSTTIEFSVTNFGPPGTFRFVAVDDRGFLSGTTFGTVSLTTGGTTQLPITVVPPGATVPLTSINLTMSVVRTDNARIGNTAAVTLETAPANAPPICDAAFAEPGELWPPNHEIIDVAILGVTDPDGDSVALAVTGITQDEPVDSTGDGRTAPDATGVGTASPSLRSERDGKGDGRVYRIAFTADDGRGGQCGATVDVGVPKSVGRIPVDSGQTFDSTVTP